MKRFLPIFTLILSITFFINYSFGLELTNIGALNLEGNRYSEWWYTEVNPTFSGTSTEDSVTVKVGDTTYTANTSNDNWSVYVPAEMGDYSVVVSDSSDSYSFTLHLGQSMGDTTTTQSTMTSTSVPTTGSNQLIAITFSIGIFLLSTYLYFWGANKPQLEKHFFKY